MIQEKEPTEFAELSVRKYQGSQGPETIECLVPMLLSCGLVQRCVRKLGIAPRQLLRLPDEILQKIAIILGQKKYFGFLNDVTEVGNEGPPFGGESV